MSDKTFSRNQKIEFTVEFFDDADKTVPVAPVSAAYPSYAIRNPIGDIVQGGTAVAYGEDGNYKVEWTVPDNAMLSNDLNEWLIEWLMVSTDGRQVQYKENFIVVDTSLETPEDHSIIMVVRENKTFRLFNYFDFDPTTISLELFPSVNTSTPVKSYVKSDMVGPVNIGGRVAYYIDVQDGLVQGDYISVWTYRLSEAAAESFEYKMVRTIRTSVLRFAESLRILIDRFNKRQSSPLAYSDSDLVEFLYQGVAWVNAYYPVSRPEITWDNVDGSQLAIFCLASAAYYALQSQYLNETDQAFQFCLDLNSYVSTDEGMVMLRYLSKENQLKDIVKDSYYNINFALDRNVVYDIITKVPNGDYPAADLLKYAPSKKTAQQIGSLFNSLRMSSFRFSDRKSHWKWHIDDEFKKTLFRNCGMSEVKCSNFPSDYSVKTPFGYQHPGLCVNMGKKRVRRIITSTGSKLVASLNHPTLVMNKDLTFSLKELSDVVKGDFVVTDRSGEDLSKFWIIDFSDMLVKLSSSNTEGKAHYKSGENVTVPKKMTSELSRLLGYLVSEGCIRRQSLRFFNKDEKLVNDYERCFYACFGGAVLKRSKHKNGTVCLKACSVTIVKFLNAVGLSCATSWYKRVPWCVMKAPFIYAKEFIQSYFEGDGRYCKGSVLFSSSSVKLREDMKQLLLRFGMVSTDRVSKNGDVSILSVRGPSLKIYADEIGFWYKGTKQFITRFGNNAFYEESHCGKKFYNSHTESLPKFVLSYIRNLRKRSKLPVTIHEKTKEGTKLVELSIDKYHGRGSSYLTYEELESYVNELGVDLKKYDKDLYKKLKRLLKYRFQFEEVVSVKNGKNTVVVGDPVLPSTHKDNGDVHPFSNLFTCSGFVTHNSGQTTTLDFDRTSNIESAMTRLKDFIDENLGKAKIALGRSAEPGSVAVRPYSVYNTGRSRVIQYEGRGKNVYGSDVWRLMVILGL